MKRSILHNYQSSISSLWHEKQATHLFDGKLFSISVFPGFVLELSSQHVTTGIIDCSAYVFYTDNHDNNDVTTRTASCGKKFISWLRVEVFQGQTFRLAEQHFVSELLAVTNAMEAARRCYSYADM